MPIMQYRCEVGRELHDLWYPFGKHPRQMLCPAHNSVANVIISKSQFIHVDHVRDTSYEQMAGPVARTWTSEADRDKWLKEQNRWVPEAGDPRVKEAFQAHEHLREERRAIEASGGSWQRVEDERRLQELNKLEADLKQEGSEIRKLSAEEFCKAANVSTGPAHKVEGNALERQFSSRASLLPDTASLSPLVPPWENPFEGNDGDFSPDDLEKEYA